MDVNEPYVSTNDSSSNKKMWVIIAVIVVVVILIIAVYFLFKMGKAGDVDAAKKAVIGIQA